ncbi:glycosyltransferase [Methylocystis sp. ATCC 49242]|uniref:glycosyltransferase n=1 Tax=Methylocystis sp. ATCC 49242 TaxID=622637 RepID=UPI000561B410|nr:glycosyltransferase [Methylocystis sp. ATCC 49242]
MISTLIALAALAAGLYLIAFHGGFWRLTEHDRRFAPADATIPPGTRVVAIVPARDEADVIATSLRSLLRQDFPGRFDIVLVDDESADGTADVARACAAAEGGADRLTVLSSRGPDRGWTGKLAAMHRGFDHVLALPEQPDFVLFCDADIAFEPPVLARLVAGAMARGTVLSSLMVKLRCESRVERWFVPAFIFFFQKLYPFTRVNDPRSKVAGAAGGVMLVRPEALARAGGLAAIRDALIDDCALGALMKTQGPIWLGLTDDVFSLRAYPSFADIERMVTRSAYAQLDYSPFQLLGAMAGMSVVYLAPPVLTIFGESPAREMTLVAWLIMAQAYMPSLRFYGLSRMHAFALPAVAACYTWFTALSAWRHLRGRGGEWKGRYQARQEQPTP